MRFPTYKYETQKHLDGFQLVAGCDEVGIAPLAGPVVAATVILDPDSIGKQRSKTKWWYRVRDSKTVNEKERDELVEFVKDHCLDFGVGVVSHETIDEINIHQAGLLAMEKSVEQLTQRPDYLFLDGVHRLKRFAPLEAEYLIAYRGTGFSFAQEPIVDGDVKVLSIAAASIVAKVARDKILSRLDEQYPEYGFIKHKGYGTIQHRMALLKYGVTPVHRLSFTFVQQVMRRPQSYRRFKSL